MLGKVSGLIAAGCCLAGALYGADVVKNRPDLRDKLLNARTVQIGNDEYFANGRSPRSVVDELRVNDFEAVYFFVTTPYGADKALIQALHDQDIPAAAMLLPSWIYPSAATLDQYLPSGWRAWKEEYTVPVSDIRIGYVYPEYNTWYKKYIRELLSFGFDGFTFAEVHFANYDGLLKNPVNFGDVSPGFQAAFKEATGNTEFPDFKNPQSPNYFKRNTKLFKALIEYRVKVINDFYNDIVNAPDGLRAAYPDIVFATWTLGDSSSDGLKKMRLWEGNDVESMVRLVQPDLHIVQTHWPDWLNPALPADYAKTYKPFFQAAKKAKPDVKIGMQADFCSRGIIRRTPEYREKYYETCKKLGIDTTTYYVFHLRWEIYNDAPVLKEIRLDKNTVRLVFDQYLSKDSAEKMLNRQLQTADGAKWNIEQTTWDGNTIICKLADNKLPAPETKVSIDVSGVADEPSIRWDYSNIEPLPKGPQNTIPDNTISTLIIQPEL